MKVLLVVFTVCVASSLGGLTDEQKVQLRGYKEACIAETGVDPAIVEIASTGQSADAFDQLPCFGACLLKKIGILDAQGNFQEKVARTIKAPDVPQEQVDDVVDRCKGLTGSNVCETGDAIWKCFLLMKTYSLV